VIKSSKGSSGLTVVRFSCKIPIFFSLSHPDGLKQKKESNGCNKQVRYFAGKFKNPWSKKKKEKNLLNCSFTYMNTASFSTTKAGVTN